jgi:hypothetical protein
LNICIIFNSVADPGCLSRIPDPDPDFYPFRIPDPGSRIPDPKTVTKERGEKNFVIILFCGHKFHKIVYYVIFEMIKKKIWANFQRIVEVFTQKIFNKLSNNGFGIQDPEKTYSRSRIQGSKRHRIPDPDLDALNRIRSEVQQYNFCKG